METDNQYGVLIVGAGPSGLLAAAWMAKAGIRTLVVERSPRGTKIGRADGLESRTLEILDSFGIGDAIWRESNKTVDRCLWLQFLGKIHRVSVSHNFQPGLSRYQEATLAQGRIEEHLQNFANDHSNIEMLWETTPTSLYRDQDPSNTFPLQVQLQSSAREDNAITVQAKYVVGCDGAHSWVRQQLNLALEGCASDDYWGVIDCIPVTNFPDVRKRCIIKSALGSIMSVPRERKLVRFYIQLQGPTAAQFKAGNDTTLLVKTVQSILKPYTFDTSQIEWSTIYRVGQRLCKTISVDDRVFLAGDAIHTHSPKAGQGMNVSMQDTYNLGWKLAMVIKGIGSPRILETYQSERFPVAERLVSFDQRIYQSIRSTGKDSHENQLASLQPTLQEENSSASGIGVIYGPSLIVTSAGQSLLPYRNLSNSLFQAPFSKPGLASNIAIGGLLPHTQVLRQCDSSSVHLEAQFQSTGAWHLIVFGGKIAERKQMIRVQNLARSLADPNFVFSQFSWNNSPFLDPFASVITYLVHSSCRNQVEPMDVPEFFRPFDPITGYDYGHIFVDEKTYHGHGGNAYQRCGISPDGCLVLLRPDQHVAFVGELEDTHQVNAFLESVFLVEGKRGDSSFHSPLHRE